MDLRRTDCIDNKETQNQNPQIMNLHGNESQLDIQEIATQNWPWWTDWPESKWSTQCWLFWNQFWMNKGVTLPLFTWASWLDLYNFENQQKKMNSISPPELN